VNILLRDARDGAWLRFSGAREVIEAHCVADVLPALARVEAAVAEGGWAAGFMAYEAAPAFDTALVTRAPGDLPLLRFGIFDAPRREADLPAPGPAIPRGWAGDVPREDYARAVGRIRDYIAAGDVYQVNFTFRLRARFDGDAEGMFSALARGANAPYATFVDAGRFVVASLSPELFFTLENGVVTSRPMKGTAPRAPSFAADEASAAALRDSGKNRAENVMITDMVRNDIGRIARPGGVDVPALFDVERHPTVWQMTSTVTGRVDAALPEILRALFPPASITGAPKARAMQVIAELESSPRGLYTGTVGFVAPAGPSPARAQFNVAIRTVVLDRERGECEYGVGSGIVWESVAEEEWSECEVKTRTLGAAAPPEFRLLETMRWDPPAAGGRGGYHLLDAHLRRLLDSAAYFQFRVDPETARRALEETTRTLPALPHRVRLLVDRAGACACEAAALAGNHAAPVRLALSPAAVDPADAFLYHKTTARAVYDAARAARPGADDVLLWNGRGEITETCTANVCVRLAGAWVTPPVACGLLPGTERARLLADGRITERVVTLADIERAEGMAVVNSVRGWRDAALTGAGARAPG
jgi:para-aminobenzoate synthetase/4-amino-4-deoxychorismate lyase